MRFLNHYNKDEKKLLICLIKELAIEINGSWRKRGIKIHRVLYF
jgi:hypothetical protein